MVRPWNYIAKILFYLHIHIHTHTHTHKENIEFLLLNMGSTLRYGRNIYISCTSCSFCSKKALTETMQRRINTVLRTGPSTYAGLSHLKWQKRSTASSMKTMGIRNNYKRFSNTCILVGYKSDAVVFAQRRTNASQFCVYVYEKHNGRKLTPFC